MTEIKGDKKIDPPRCGEDYEGYRYRAIMPAPSLIAEDAPPIEGVLDCTEGDLDSYVDFYGELDACWKPDPEQKGLKIFYLTLDQALKVGGQDHPYPESVEACDEDAYLSRAPVVETGDNKNLLMINRHALLKEAWEDPSDEHIDYIPGILGDVNGSGFCQMKISDNPESHGIFIVDRVREEYLKNPFAPFEGIPLTDDGMGALFAHEYMRILLPRDMSECIMPIEVAADRVLWKMSIEDGFKALEDGVADPRIREIVTPEIIEQVLSSYDMDDLGEWEYSALSNIVSFVLEKGLCEEEVGDLLSDVVSSQFNSKDRVYSFFAIASLRLARKLHHEFREQGGIIADFDDMEMSVERAILDGRIGVRTMSAADLLKLPAAFAHYDYIKNEIAFPPIGPDLSMALFFEAIVHECTHAYQDILAKPITVFEAEREAHEVGVRAMTLLMHRSPEFAGIDGEILSTEYMSYVTSSWRERLVEQQCMGFPQSMLVESAELFWESQKAFLDLHLFAQMGLYDLDNVFDGLFKSFIKPSTKLNFISAVLNHSMIQKGYEYEAWRGAFVEAPKYVGVVRMNGDPKVFEATPEGGKEALNLLALYAHDVSIAFYNDRNLMRVLLENPPYDPESMAEALLSFQFPVDGV